MQAPLFRCMTSCHAKLTKQSRCCCGGGVGQAVDGVLDSEGQATERQNALARSSLGVDGSRLLQDLFRQQPRLSPRGLHEKYSTHPPWLASCLCPKQAKGSRAGHDIIRFRHNTCERGPFL